MSALPAFVAVAITATFSPLHPTVGDRVTIVFDRAPVVLHRSEAFEIIEQKDNRVVIRTFEPQPLPLSGVAGDAEFRNLVLPVHSVLRPNDDLKPAPLVPPIGERQPLLPLIAIGIAALAAAIAWTLLVLRRERRVASEPALTPQARYRQRLRALRARPSWSELADALRELLAATSDLSLDLTTTEIVDRTNDATIATILRQGDLEKFSLWGAAPMDFGEAIDRALELAPEIDEELAA